MTANIVPFGKHKGRLLEELLLDDPNYLQWLASQDWFRAKYATLYQIVINRGAEPEETPEHNALQVMFLDDAFCLAFMRCLWPNLDEKATAELKRMMPSLEPIERKIAEVETSIHYSSPSYAGYRDEKRCTQLREELAQLRKQEEEALLHADIGEIIFKFNRHFEERGVDVRLNLTAHSTAHGLRIFSCGDGWNDDLKIEIKPTVGDDYPAVLRQMRANESRFLLVGDYTGKGASREQFIATFATASMRVVFLDAVKARQKP